MPLSPSCPSRGFRNICQIGFKRIPAIFQTANQYRPTSGSGLKEKMFFLSLTKNYMFFADAGKWESVD
jgi:hypothetical protein